MSRLPVIDYDAHPAYAVAAPEPEHDLAGRLQQEIEVKRGMLARSRAIMDSRVNAVASGGEADTLARRGAVALHLPPGRLNRVREAAEPVLKALRGQVAIRHAIGKTIAFKHTNFRLMKDGVAEPEHAELVLQVARLLKRNGMREIASAYYPGSRPVISGMAVRNNVPRQDSFTNLLSHVGRPDPKTLGMHIDSSSAARLNAIIYLNEVGTEQGPFKYVIGSNHWEFDREDRAIRKAMDELGVSAPYHAGPFMALPAALRRKANFGSDLIDGTPESDRLLGQEAIFTSDQGELLFFDSDGVHRGGNVSEGHRAAILITIDLRTPS